MGHAELLAIRSMGWALGRAATIFFGLPRFCENFDRETMCMHMHTYTHENICTQIHACTYTHARTSFEITHVHMSIHMHMHTSVQL